MPSTAPFPQELWGVRICALISCYVGSAEEGEQAMQPVREALPPPILDWMSEMPLPALRTPYQNVGSTHTYFERLDAGALPIEAIDVLSPEMELARQAVTQLCLARLDLRRAHRCLLQQAVEKRFPA